MRNEALVIGITRSGQRDIKKSRHASHQPSRVAPRARFSPSRSSPAHSLSRRRAVECGLSSLSPLLSLRLILPTYLPWGIVAISATMPRDLILPGQVRRWHSLFATIALLSWLGFVLVLAPARLHSHSRIWSSVTMAAPVVSSPIQARPNFIHCLVLVMRLVSDSNPHPMYLLSPPIAQPCVRSQYTNSTGDGSTDMCGVACRAAQGDASSAWLPAKCCPRGFECSTFIAGFGQWVPGMGDSSHCRRPALFLYFAFQLTPVSLRTRLFCCLRTRSVCVSQTNACSLGGCITLLHLFGDSDLFQIDAEVRIATNAFFLCFQ